MAKRPAPKRRAAKRAAPKRRAPKAPSRKRAAPKPRKPAPKPRPTKIKPPTRERVRAELARLGLQPAAEKAVRRPPKRRRTARPGRYGQHVTLDQGWENAERRLAELKAAIESPKFRRALKAGKLSLETRIKPGVDGSFDAQASLKNLPKRFARRKFIALLGEQGISLEAAGLWLSAYHREAPKPAEAVEAYKGVELKRGVASIGTGWKRAAGWDTTRESYRDRSGHLRWRDRKSRLAGPAIVNTYLESSMDGWQQAHPGNQVAEIGWRWHYSLDGKRPVRR